MAPKNNYRVWLRSTPGFYAQYSGKIDVYAESQEDAIDAAFTKLKLGAFPDRNRTMWKVERVEQL